MSEHRSFTEVYPRLTAGFHRVKPYLPVALALLLAALGLLALNELTREVKPDAILGEIRAASCQQLLLAGLFTVLSYIALAGYDASAMAYLKVRMPLRRLALGSFAGYAFGNTVGMGVLTGGAVRMRVYRGYGLDTTGVAKLMAFISTGFGLGITSVAAVGLLVRAKDAAELIPFPAWVLHLLGGLAISSLLWVLGLCARGKPLRFFNQQIPLPGLGLALTQVVVSALDILFASLVLWALLPHAGLDFGAYLAFYALAISLTIISHVPGGVGVFDAVMLLAFKNDLPAEQIAGALVLFRLIYFAIPLGIAMLLLGMNELAVRWGSKATP